MTNIIRLRTSSPPDDQRIADIKRQASLAYLRAGTGGGGGDTVQISLTSDAVVISLTANTSIPNSQDGATYDNNGATGDITATLPAWTAGLLYSFAPIAAHLMTVAANGADKIGASQGLVASLTNSNQYEFLSVLATNSPGVWIVRTMIGGWTG